jgi:hypothetical protein
MQLYSLNEEEIEMLIRITKMAMDAYGRIQMGEIVNKIEKAFNRKVTKEQLREKLTELKEQEEKESAKSEEKAEA